MLELSHISKTYKTSKGIQTQALKDINLKFPKKGMVFILGKSGSGKSTLLNVIGGLDQADEGEVIIHGKSSKDFTQADYDAYRNTYIGFIFQEFYLMDEYTIEKNIALSLQLQQKEASAEEIEAILSKVGLSGFGSRYPNELSGGQKQRVAIARSLIKQPEILMADEPTGALDSSTGKEIFTTLKELSKEKLVIVVSHDEDAARQYADRIITFSDGSIIDDTNPQVDDEVGTFVQIRSHLPFKDSFHLGITCLKHKKIRMVFTILLTSFALLTLALSDSIGNFNGADAQYKAMSDHNESLIGIKRQLVDADGNTMIGYEGMVMNQIKTDAAAKIVEESGRKMAKVYDSQNYRLTLPGMGIASADLNLFESTSETFFLTEMNGFEDLNYTDVVGTFPKDYTEMAISSYVADIIINHGIKDENGKLQHPASYEELIGKIKIPVVDTWVTISGIVKKDLSAYDHLKNMTINQLNEENYKDYRVFSQIVNHNCDKLFVKDGFVASLKLPKSNMMVTNMSSVVFENNNRQTMTGQLAYINEEVQYFDGETMVTTKELAKNEVIWGLDTLSNYFNDAGGAGIYSESFSQKSESERESMIKDLAQQVIGKKMQMNYREFYNAKDTVFDEEVVVKGVILPESYDDEHVYMLMNTYAAKELVEPNVKDAFFLGELLTSAGGNDAKQILKTYTIEDEYSAVTIATSDVKNIKAFAEFATQVFFWASIAFFCFAAILMMNFIVVSISYRKKEIGILRSIGARSMDVVKIFVWEALILAMISYLVTIVTLYGLSAFVNHFAMDTIGIIISPVIITLRQPLLLIIIVFAIAFIASFIPILKIARQRPIDAIKK